MYTKSVVVSTLRRKEPDDGMDGKSERRRSAAMAMHTEVNCLVGSGSIVGHDFTAEIELAAVP